jgi:hypothetical protein
MKQVLLTFFLVATYACVSGQEDQVPQYQITTIPSQLFFLDVNTIVEKYEGRYGLGFLLGFKPASNLESTESYIDLHAYRPYWHFTIGTHAKYFYNEAKRRFFELGLFVRIRKHKDLYNTMSRVTNKDRPSYFAEEMHVVGLKLLIGDQGKVVLNKTGAICVEGYGGIGVRARFEKVRDYSSIPFDRNNSYTIKPVTRIIPSIHLGLKVGYMRFRSS